MKEIYQVPEGADNKPGEIGRQIMPPAVAGSSLIVYREVILDRGDSLVEALISMYNSRERQRAASEGNPELIAYLAELGLSFADGIDEGTGERSMRVVLTDECYEFLTSWKLEADLSSDDRSIGLTNRDPAMPAFIAKEVLDAHAGKEMAEAVAAGAAEVAQREG